MIEYFPFNYILLMEKPRRRLSSPRASRRLPPSSPLSTLGRRPPRARPWPLRSPSSVHPLRRPPRLPHPRIDRSSVHHRPPSRRHSLRPAGSGRRVQAFPQSSSGGWQTKRDRRANPARPVRPAPSPSGGRASSPSLDLQRRTRASPRSCLDAATIAASLIISWRNATT